MEHRITDTEEKKPVLIGDTVTIFCSYDNPEKVNPPPSMRIFMVSSGDLNEEGEHVTSDNELLLAKGGIEDNVNSTDKFIGFNQLKATKKITRDDMNKQIVCECDQKFEDKEIFTSSVSSDSLNIFQKPTIVQEYILPDYYLVNKTNFSSSVIIIPIKFSSIPRPEDKYITWMITEYDDESVGEDAGEEVYNESNEDETYIIHPGTLISHFSTQPLKLLKNDVYEARIELKNVTRNISISLEVGNPYGTFRELLPGVIVITKQNMTAEKQVMKATGPMMWVIVLIVAILVISIIMFSFMVCIKRKNKKHQEELDEIDNNENVQVEKSVYKKEKIVMDQNDLSFHMSELGESKKLQRIIKKQSDFKASLQDLRSSFDVVPSNKQFKWKQLPRKDKIKNIKGKSTRDQIIEVNNHQKITINEIEKDKKISSKSCKVSSPKLQTPKTKYLNKDRTESNSEEEERENSTKPVMVEKQMTKRVTFIKEDEKDFSLNTGSENESLRPVVLRHSGPTNYPVMAPPDEDDSFKKTPSRVTSPIHFTGPTEVFVPITIISKDN